MIPGLSKWHSGWNSDDDWNTFPKSFYRAQEVYPLSPLLGGGFPKEGGDACSTTNSFGIGGGCGTSGGVSKINKMSIERRCRLHSGRASSPSGANNPFARGEQSVGSGRTIRPQDCGKRAQNQSYIQFIGRKRFTLSALSSGEVFQRRGEMLVRL